MSLLLEALKKAERAKEEAQRRAQSERSGENGGGPGGDAGGGSAGRAELRLEPTLAPSPPPEEPRRVLTRAELPDIKQPLEIVGDDLTPTPANEPAAARPEPAPSPAPATAVPPQPAADRATARKVFEAKFREPNPRLPFFITLGFLGVFALGTVGYFWYQLRPPAPLVNANPTPPANEAPAPLVAAAPRAEPAAPAQTVVIPGLPSAAAASPAPPAAPPEPPAAAPAAAAKPSPAPEAPRPRVAAAPRRAAPAAAPTPAPRVERFAPAAVQSRPAPRVDPKVESAYAAYQAGDLATARADYQEALRADASNRDALLGVAAIDVRTGRYEAAEATYLRLLQLDPNDAHAQAGLIALRTGRLDPLATESRVKSMLATDPGAHVLHFTLGNQLARQGRWAEAQQEYFKAFAAAPGNADFAYNLAVSLDHLRQGPRALEYYQRALALAGAGGASFDLAAARSRAAQLAR